MNDKYFMVGMPELHIAWVRVKANSEEQAMEKAEDGDYDSEVNVVYDRTLDQDPKVFSCNKSGEKINADGLTFAEWLRKNKTKKSATRSAQNITNWRDGKSS